MMPGIVIGKYTGTGSTVCIPLGFRPDAVLIFQQAPTVGPVFMSFRGDTTSTAISISTTISQLTTGVVYRDGLFGDATTIGMGFEVSGGTAGNAGALSVSGAVYKYLAFRSEAGQINKLAN